MIDQTAVRSRPAATAQDALLATKLHVPPLRPDRVLRPRLMDLLDHDAHRGLLLVCAPAGYGKTVLLTEWTSRSGRKVAWLSLDAGDNDPTRFWRHLVAAIDPVLPGTVDLFGDVPASGSFQMPATALINGLAVEPGEADVLLVLDDYHLIETPAVHELVDFLLAHRPANLHLVLASRSDPPLALARLRARGELAELRVGQLRFTPKEAAVLLRQAALNGELPDASLAALAARTEGWAAGLQLAALSLRGHPDVPGFIASFTGSHRHVLDYLTEEVLERQSEDERSFLTETSVLERLSGPLCDALTGRTDSQATLERLERAGLFLIPLDEVRGWWRYHHLFADLLRARLHRDQAAALHRAAAGWYLHHGLVDDAIHHTLAAGDTLAAARLVEAHFDTVFYLRGEETTIRGWLLGFSEQMVRSRPRLLLAQAQMAGMRGDVEAMEPLTDAAEQISDRARDEPFEPTAGEAGSLLVNVPALVALQRSYSAQLRGDADGAAVHATRALARAADDEHRVAAAAQGFLAMSDWLRGRLGEAEHGFASRLARWRSEFVPTSQAFGYYALARIQRAQGNLDASEQTCLAALDDTAGTGRRALPATGPALVGRAEVAYQRNDLDAATGHLDEGIPLCRRFVDTPPLAAGLATLAWIRHAIGDPDGAREAMCEAEQSSPAPFGLLNPVPAQAAKLHLVQGDVAAAARWTQRSELRADDELSYPREAGHLVLARVLLAGDRPDEAVALLGRLHAAAVAQHRTGSIIETGALRALALAAARDEQAALTALVEALELARPQRHVRVFADEGAPMSALLGRLGAARRTGRIGAEIPDEFLLRVQRAVDTARPQSDGARRTPASPLIDPLTARESEILDLVAHGMSNQAIAAELVVSLDTVKKHVTHILDKLGASNRTEAVARSRELGLLN